MMKFRGVRLHAVACLVFAAVLVVLPARAAEPVFPLGARLGLVPPGAMKLSPHFRGFEDRDSKASILILELPAAAHAQLEKELTPTALKKQGMREEKRETVRLKAGKGLLIVGRQQADGKTLRKWILLASAAETAALIAVQVPEAAARTYSDAVVRAALSSLVARPAVPLEEQLRLLPFDFDDLAGLRPFRVVGTHGVFLTDGAKDTLAATEQPLLIVSMAPGGPQQPSDRENFVRSLLTGISEFKDVHIVSSDVLRLNHQQIYELQAEAKDAKSDVPVKLVQWVRFGNGAFLRFVGIARADVWGQAFPRFRTVRDAVKPRD